MATQKGRKATKMLLLFFFLLVRLSAGLMLGSSCLLTTHDWGCGGVMGPSLQLFFPLKLLFQMYMFDKERKINFFWRWEIGSCGWGHFFCSIEIMEWREIFFIVCGSGGEWSERWNDSKGEERG